MPSKDSFGAKSTLDVAGTTYEVFRLDAVDGAADLPYSLKVLLENLLRTEDGANITADSIRAIAQWDPSAEPDTEIQFTPARVLMQDFTGVPAIVDLAAMRDAMEDLGGDPALPDAAGAPAPVPGGENPGQAPAEIGRASCRERV